MISKKVVIISNFHENVNISRSKKAYDYFISKGFDVEVLYSSFSHSLKCERNINLPHHKKIKTISYSNNISMRRIVSHFLYCFRVLSFLKNKKIDVIYIIYPPNVMSLVVLVLRKNVEKIIIDIIDLWPEAFKTKKKSIKNFFLTPIYFISSYFRKKSLLVADACLTESNYFSRVLEYSRYKVSKVLYLSKDDFKNFSFENTSDELSIAYLGNIGHAYDFESLLFILSEVKKKRNVSIQIIGTGPLKEYLIDQLKSFGIKYYYHGASFDENLKKNLLSTCWFGFNGYKKGYPVALSYKSVDYLSYGLPLLNSAIEDTSDLVKKYNIGFNFDSTDLNLTIKNLSQISLNEVLEMKKSAYDVFEEKFSKASYIKIMNKVLHKIKI